MAPCKTEVLSAHKDGAIDRAVEQLITGSLVALPTETVYGLAADALNATAVREIYTVKGRPSHNPLICHVSGIDMARRFASVSETAEKLITHFWPGPLTLVLPRRQAAAIPPIVSARLDTLAVRCPDSDITRAIIEKLGHPLAAPSANPSGKLSPTCAEDVQETLNGKVPLIIDGGRTQVGLESTIVAIDGERTILLRPGSITADDISAVTGQPVYDRDSDIITAPGQLASHYAPDAPVRLNATERQPGEILIGFGDTGGDFNLSPAGDLAEAAHKLFALLREADNRSAAAIAVAPIPMIGIGIAINDRLLRAAAPRGPA